MNSQHLLNKIKNEIILTKNCFHCGLCEGLTKGLFKMIGTTEGPIPKQARPFKKTDASDLEKIYLACPARGVPYNYLSRTILSNKKSKLIGNYNNISIASSNNKNVRVKGSSGGIVRSILIFLKKKNYIDGAYVLDKDPKKIFSYTPKIVNSTKKFENLSQSIYITTSFLQNIKKLNKKKKYCLVGLPEHIAAIKILKKLWPKDFQHIKYLIGIYAGTNMYPGSIDFYLKSMGYLLKDIKKIFWRYGEWPGFLKIITQDGNQFIIKKFYYNYLIPFFISKNCLRTPDLTSELSDISIGDAWSPKLENKGHGYSVVITRTKFFDKLLKTMNKNNQISNKEISIHDCISMHAHMIEFKKIGSYLRIKDKNLLFPDYDLKPLSIGTSRVLIEKIIKMFLFLASIKLLRYIVVKINPQIVGFFFEKIRVFWKFLSKPIKRNFFLNIKFEILTKSKRRQEIIKYQNEQSL